MEASIDDDESSNPYIQMRQQKIARNQQRLLELGLLTKPQDLVSSAMEANATNKSSNSVGARRKQNNYHAVQPLRRSARNRKVVSDPRDNDVVEGDNYDTKISVSVAKRQKIDNPALNEKTVAVIAATRNPKHSAPPRNSARSISLDATKLVSGLLLRPVSTFGKEFVVSTSFQEAAHEEDRLRFASSSTSLLHISFNKYCGVQEWKNATFLWVNIDNNAGSDYINEFRNGGRHMTWYGGSKMREDSPIIQKLIREGKAAAANDSTKKSTATIETSPGTPKGAFPDAIILWCRTYNSEAKKLTPYTCFGRCSYVQHEVGSQPVAFVWNLLDYDIIVRDEEKKRLFYSMIGQEG